MQIKIISLQRPHSYFLVLQIVKDVHLFVMVLAFMLVDTLLLLVWFVVDPLKWRIVKLDTYVSHTYLEQCYV